MKHIKRFKHHLLILLAIITLTMVFIGCDSNIGSQGAPVVESTSPMHRSTGTAITSEITATFNESMDPTTITAETFTVSKAGDNISGTVAFDAPTMTVTFTPAANLENSTEYLATLTTGVKDLAGTPMTEEKEWDFITVSTGINPSPVNLGTAADFVMLAKTAISTIPNSMITGDVGLSPSAETYLTGFSQTDATGYATSTQVVGNLYASDMADPTPMNLTTAVEDMITAYNDASGRINPNFIDIGAGEIGSRTLAHGLYKWTTSVTIGSDVTINGGADDIWIFQIAGDLNLSNDFDVILSGGAQAKNIVWQVSGTVTMGAGSHLEGIVLSMTSITMNTGASMNGRLLAQTNIALDQATVTKPAE
ncbi:MAG: ice-binding family protein [Sphaerochaetaceae bacterium]